jgi:hypothetical protein
MSLGPMAISKAATIKLRSSSVLAMACATLIISAKEFSSVIHKNGAGALAPTPSVNYSILALPQLLT